VTVLSDDFYREIRSSCWAAPPAVLDLYMWLSYRCFKAKDPESIPIFGEFGLANHLGCVECSRPRRFRAMLGQWITTIRAIWPDCPAAISGDGRSIQVGPKSAVNGCAIP